MAVERHLYVIEERERWCKTLGGRRDLSAPVAVGRVTEGSHIGTPASVEMISGSLLSSVRNVLMHGLVTAHVALSPITAE